MSRSELALVLGLVFTCVGCRAKVGEHDEDRPAPPCSVNGMLFRDTPATDFERCGESELPLRGEVGECVKAAVAAKRPFVVELKPLGPSLVRAQSAIVGAQFDGSYGVRSYLGDPREGQRSAVELGVAAPGSPELVVRSDLESVLRCVQGADLPDADDPGWRALGPERRHMFHPGDCVEWFDDAQWQEQPWALGHHADQRLECAR
jgi:hypothetical protein